MSTADEIKEIQERIWALQGEQKVLRDKERQENIEEIRRLDWLKGKTVVFQRNPYPAAGVPTYTLMLVGKVDLIEGVVGFGGHVCLYGDHNLYEYNIIIRSSDVWGSRVYTMETSSLETLMKFVHEADLKFAMDKKDVALYRIILDRLADSGQ